MPTDAEFTTLAPETMETVHSFAAQGPHVCTGCSSTAAGYGNALQAGEALHAWSY
jgi:hypothetical protein